jgi:hypothetical protein
MSYLDKLINTVIILILFIFLSFSDVRLSGLQDSLHILAVDHAYDFSTWTADAVWIKISQSSIDAPRYFGSHNQHNLVIQYLQALKDFQATNEEIKLIYSDPSVIDPVLASASLRGKLDIYSRRMTGLAPFAEATLEMQVAQVLSQLGLTSGGQPIPWVLYHSSPLPQNLVVSRRDKIGQETNYVLTPLSIADAANLENKVDKSLNVSSLVVDVGGLSAYPTMIMFTTNLDYLTSTIAHEWTHIYLIQRPLGNNYTTPETRTMNETTAAIAGKEIGRIVIQQFYPEMKENSSTATQFVNLLTSENSSTTVPFDFRAEMHTTRVHTDELLALGEIDQAEAYMELRRKIFWEHNYPIRKLNQAYFAFHGAYADTPGGEAGEDPVGPAVRALREQSTSLKQFLERISAMTSFADLQKSVGNINK